MTDALKERLTYEINVVKTMGYTNYYLIVYDFINYAKSHDIPWGRGAAPAQAVWLPTAWALLTLTPSAIT